MNNTNIHVDCKYVYFTVVHILNFNPVKLKYSNKII